MGGLVFQARNLDRRLLNELTLEDWLKTAEKMQDQLTDDVIEAAVYDMPKQIADISGNTIIAKLKSRRDKLPEFAKNFYAILAKEVDIVGTNKPEKFEVERLNNDETKVTVHSLSNKGKEKDKYYQRVFKHSETKEIRLYGLAGRDEFEIKGKVGKGIKIRIIGGKGKDEITDKSKVKGLFKKTLVYDNKKNNEIRFGSEAKDMTSNNPIKNAYRYNAFNYPKLIPLPIFGYNADDGFILGAGFLLNTYGFQKYPYASNQKLGLSYSFGPNSPEFEYDGLFTDAFYGLDLNLHIDLRGPKYAQNYFGLGNESKKTTENKYYYHVRIGQILINPEFSKPINANNNLFFGIFYNIYHVEDTEGRFIMDFSQNGLDSAIFAERKYIGLNAGYLLDTRDHKVLPTRGIYWESKAKFYYGVSGTANKFSNMSTDLGMFLSFRKPYRTVFAFRIGGSINTGDYEFFQACSLGGKTNLRGYRASRYSGDACLYQNSEIRFKLFNFANYLFKGGFGLIGFNDIGRIWLKGESSRMWHHGYGGGIWLSPFKLAVFSSTYEFSGDEDPGLFSIRFRYLF